MKQKTIQSDIHVPTMASIDATKKKRPRQMTAADVAEAKKHQSEVLKVVNELPEGMVKAEFLKAMTRIEKKIKRELEASSVAWATEPTIRLIENSGITIGGAHDLLVLLIHYLLQEEGLICMGLGDSAPGAPPGALNATGGTRRDGADADADEAAPKSPPTGWNEGDGVYAFKYTSPKLAGSDVLVLKALQMGDTVSVHLLHKKTGKSESVDLSATDYVANDRIIKTESLAALRDRLSVRLLQSLFPPPSPPRKTQTPAPAPAPAPAPDPLRVPGRGRRPYVRPFGGDFEGDLRPHFGGGFGGLGIRGGGSLVGPRHPMFGRGPHPGFGGSIPGARFDPFGPTPGTGFRPGRPAPGPTRPGFGGDHLRPPGFDDGEPPPSMYY